MNNHFLEPAEAESAWVKEAEDRLEAYKRGDLEAIPSELVFQEADDLIAK